MFNYEIVIFKSSGNKKIINVCSEIEYDYIDFRDIVEKVILEALKEAPGLLLVERSSIYRLLLNYNFIATNTTATYDFDPYLGLEDINSVKLKNYINSIKLKII